jgi:hypothetical protein
MWRQVWQRLADVSMLYVGPGGTNGRVVYGQHSYIDISRPSLAPMTTPPTMTRARSPVRPPPIGHQGSLLARLAPVRRPGGRFRTRQPRSIVRDALAVRSSLSYQLRKGQMKAEAPNGMAELTPSHAR